MRTSLPGPLLGKRKWKEVLVEQTLVAALRELQTTISMKMPCGLLLLKKSARMKKPAKWRAEYRKTTTKREKQETTTTVPLVRVT